MVDDLYAFIVLDTMNERENGVQIANIDDGEWTGEDPDGGRWKRLGQQTGGTHLGCTLEEIQPGGRPAAYHYHLANEEAMYVIDGNGRLSFPGRETDIKSGDYVAFPVGEGGAHAVENTADDTLRCLFFSTMRKPDVTVYPNEKQLHVGAIDATFSFESDSDEAEQD